jgi:hypothetical protein
MTGFQANFYGFFVYAILWVALYFLLAAYSNRRDRR